MNIGFDLDKVFIDTPPFIPDKVIEKIYRKTNAPKLTYRIPGRTEQFLRIFFHYSFFRPPISININTFAKNKDKNHKYFLISSRFSFLKYRTNRILQKYKIAELFNEIHLNFNNWQPHIFKSRMIDKYRINKFIDDDKELLLYLCKMHPKTKFYWLNRTCRDTLKDNLIAITSIKDALIK